MQRRFELGFSIAVVVVVAWFVLQALGVRGILGPMLSVFPDPIVALLPRGWGARSSLFPLVVGIPILALAIAQLALDLRGRDSAPGGTDSPELDLPREVVAHRSRIIIATIVGFALAIWMLGFVVAVPLVTFLYLKVGARERWPISIALAAAAGIFFFAVFVRALNVPSPPGPILEPLYNYLGL